MSRDPDYQYHWNLEHEVCRHCKHFEDPTREGYAMADYAWCSENDDYTQPDDHPIDIPCYAFE